jgi:hypothetical protein
VAERLTGQRLNGDARYGWSGSASEQALTLPKSEGTFLFVKYFTERAEQGDETDEAGSRSHAGGSGRG